MLEFLKMHDGVILPSKNSEDLGYDIYANFTHDHLKIKKGETCMVSTGLKTRFPDTFGMLLRERGSTGTRGMSIRAGVIDSGFRGEIFVCINNTSNRDIIIYKDDSLYNSDDVKEAVFDYITLYPYSKAICQAIMVNNIHMGVSEVSNDEYKTDDSVRGEGKLGDSLK